MATVSQPRNFKAPDPGDTRFDDADGRWLKEHYALRIRGCWWLAGLLRPKAQNCELRHKLHAVERQEIPLIRLPEPAFSRSRREPRSFP